MLAFVLTVTALWAGGRLSTMLPQHHLSQDARDSAKIGIGMLATLLALVLGLMITSAKRSFDERAAEVVQLSTSIVLLDHALAGLGEESRPARAELRKLLENITQLTRPHAYLGTQEVQGSIGNLRTITQLQKTILDLQPITPTQKWFQARSMELSTTVAQDRVLSSEQSERSVPPILLLIVCGWIVLIYLGLGVFMVSNKSVNVALGVCALAFACSIFIILELDTPFSGVVAVSDASLVRAQAELMP